MPKLTLQGCKHPITKIWGNPFNDENLITLTCMVCYERLIADGDHITLGRVTRSNDYSDLPHAPAAPMCQHAHKTVIEKDPKYKHGDYTDALCGDCGVVLRHPEGPGGWHEVLFNGYVIREEP